MQDDGTPNTDSGHDLLDFLEDAGPADVNELEYQQLELAKVAFQDVEKLMKKGDRGLKEFTESLNDETIRDAVDYI